MKKVKAFFVAVGLVALTSCGGGSDPGGNVTLYKTVKVTATATPSPYVVQIASGNTCTNSVISGTVSPALVPSTVSVSSSKYNSSITGQNVNLSQYVVSFSPIGSAPAIPGTLAGGLDGWFGGFVAPGATSSASIDLTSIDLDNFFATTDIGSCTPTAYKYYATISIAGTEESGTNGTIRAVVPVTFTNVQ